MDATFESKRYLLCAALKARMDANDDPGCLVSTDHIVARIYGSGEKENAMSRAEVWWKGVDGRQTITVLGTNGKACKELLRAVVDGYVPNDATWSIDAYQNKADVIR